MRIHPYLRAWPRVRLYVSRPLRAGCVARAGLLLVLALLGVVVSLYGQVGAVLRINGRDASMIVANPTANPLRVTVTLFRDSTLTDTVPARITPDAFTLDPGTRQVVRLRLKQQPDTSARYRLGTTFTPVEPEAPAQPTMRLTLATRLITRVKVEGGP